MRVTMYYYGGSSYACFDCHDPRDAEVFDSVRDAVKVFSDRASRDPYYPCIDEIPQDEGGPVAWLFFGDDHPVVGQEYPDRIISFGPRGGVHVDRC